MNSNKNMLTTYGGGCNMSGSESSDANAFLQYLHDLSDITEYVVADRITGKRVPAAELFLPLDLGTDKFGKEGDLSGRLNLIIAGAGSGKTTLLKRLANVYVHRCLNEGNNDRLQNKESDVFSKDESLTKKYALPIIGFPFFLKLRDMEKAGFFISKAVSELTGDMPDHTLLFLDGLDEVPEEKRSLFIQDIKVLSESNPDMRIYITSRISGKSGVDVRAFEGFNEVTLLPLSDMQIREYVGLRTGFSEVSDPEIVSGRVSEIIKKLSGQGGLMCRPLELDMILESIDRLEPDAVPDRYALFENMLFHLLTSRNRTAEKEVEFADGMTILSALSFVTHCRETVYADKDDVNTVQKMLEGATFAAFDISGGIGAFLDKISKNTGIIEETKDGGYSFPVRSYQEFLAAYYCLNLAHGSSDGLFTSTGSVNPEKSDATSVPDTGRFTEPVEVNPGLSVIICKLNDPFWLETIIFILQGLKKDREAEFDKAIKYVFANLEDERAVMQVTQNVPVTRDGQAGVMCERVFNETSFRDRELMFSLMDTGENSDDILFSCLISGSGHIWRRVINSIYRERLKSEILSGNFRDMFKPFLRASAYCRIFEGEKLPGADDISALLDSENRSDYLLGACIISELVSIGFGEKLAERKEEAKAVICSFSDVKRLAQLAHDKKDYICIKALSDIWVADVSASEEAGEALDDTLLEHLINMMNNSEEQLLDLWEFDINGVDFMDGLRSTVLASTIGSLPLSRRFSRDYITSLPTTVFIKGQFMFLRDLWKIDVVGTGAAYIYCIRNRQMFTDIWETIVREVVEQGECGERGRTLYRLQSERLKMMGYTSDF